MRNLLKAQVYVYGACNHETKEYEPHDYFKMAWL